MKFTIHLFEFRHLNLIVRIKKVYAQNILDTLYTF